MIFSFILEGINSRLRVTYTELIDVCHYNESVLNKEDSLTVKPLRHFSSVFCDMSTNRYNTKYSCRLIDIKRYRTDTNVNLYEFHIKPYSLSSIKEGRDCIVKGKFHRYDITRDKRRYYDYL